MTTATLSPMMAQWQACKEKAHGALLLFRLGDFYEAFEEDAVVLARELDLTLTKRQETPMSGVPFHAAEGYIDKLVSKGYRVAIAEQVEDPKATKGLVKREVVRIVTPGTVINSSLLSEKQNNFIGAIVQIGSNYGLALLDLTTADFRLLEAANEQELADALFSYKPSELLLSEKTKKLVASLPTTLTLKEPWFFDPQTGSETLFSHFKVKTLDGFGLKSMPASTAAAGALLTYVRDDLNLSISHIQNVQTEAPTAFMAIDHVTQRHLELTEDLHDRKKESTLLQLIDRTATPMGGRLLKEWLLHPLLLPEKIFERQEAIATFLKSKELIEKLSSALTQVRDLERLIMRIETGYASPRDLVALRFSLEAIPSIADLLRPLTAPLLASNLRKLKDLSETAALIRVAINETASLRLSDGKVINPGYSSELDALRSVQSGSHTWIADYQTKLREETQIKTLKVGYTNAFGYFIEVSRGQADRVPAHFQRKQTLVNGERFITPELKQYEHRILNAEEKIFALESKLFHEVRTQIIDQARAIREIAQAVAQIDALHSLTLVAHAYHYCRPLVDQSDRLEIREGRHPVIESQLKGECFIPNDLLLDRDKMRLMLITGPNMAGKSTFIRQTALIAIMAQMGSFVPAASAHIGIVDKVFSRIGASDDIARGQSTFMVEMAETANILRNCTSKSLVILDEIGRGTSTYDGISIAWAVAEYLLTHPLKGAKTLFATHYFELTRLEDKIPGAVNFNVAVHESEEGIVFLHKIVKGSAARSYGIHVAKLAGLPHEVVRRAESLLLELERGKRASPSLKEKPSDNQLAFF